MLQALWAVCRLRWPVRRSQGHHQFQRCQHQRADRRRLHAAMRLDAASQLYAKQQLQHRAGAGLLQMAGHAQPGRPEPCQPARQSAPDGRCHRLPQRAVLMRALRTLLDCARRLRAAEAGVAAVEFALILPIMLLVYIGTVEASVLISMDRKIQSVSGAVGDLVARSRGEITSTLLNDYVKVAGGIMTPYPA
ncbi:MAG: hypothetical protein B7Z15_17290 [Rhizobiales bacterium 32-66-8]|nr:MAG: hypothetical protein B7Z15_17290 [Rhizobiales bacterium 32-66-8]